MNETETEMLLEIERMLREDKNALLMEVVPHDCGCANKTKRVFRCPNAFKINMLLDKIDKARRTP